MMGLKVEILVRVSGLPVDRDAILSSPEQRVKEGECPIFLLHSELNGQPDPVEMSEELFAAWSPS